MAIDLKLNEADLLEIEREYCSRSLANFAKQAWEVLEPTATLKWGWVLDAICLHLEAVTNGEIKRLLINVPPGTMKSLLTSVIWPAWEWGPKGRPETRYISTSHEENLAIRDSRRCRDLIKSEWYQSLWPIELARDLDGKKEFGNTRKGIRQARSFTSMTGVRGDRVIVDDPISADNANSAAALNSAKTTFLETIPTRVNSSDSAIVVIMQRLHEEDVSGVILEKGLDYVHMCVPMRFEKDRKCSTAIGWEDPRTEEGELMFPERFPEADLDALELAMGSYATAGQHQQAPHPRGGGIFKTEWFQTYFELPKLEWRRIFVDTAQKTKEQNDYSVFQCWGRSETGQAVLIDMLRGKWEAPELLSNARAFFLKHQNINTGSVLQSMCVEDKVSGTGLIQTLRREGVPVQAIQRNRDKITRGYDAAPFIESGNVLIPASAPWMNDFIRECEAFPAGAHDDTIDPMIDAIAAVQTIGAQTHINIRPPMPTANRW